MNRLTALCFGCCCAVVAQAGDIYRWTDAQGRVHYGERPPHEQAEKLDLPKATPGSAAVPADEASRRLRRQRLLESFEYEREQKKVEQAKAAEQRRQQARACERAQRYWRGLLHPGPIYITQDNGERKYLSDEQRRSEQARFRPRYRKLCGEEP